MQQRGSLRGGSCNSWLCRPYWVEQGSGADGPHDRLFPYAGVGGVWPAAHRGRRCRAGCHARECKSPVQGYVAPKDKGKVAALPAPTPSRHERQGVGARWGRKAAGNERAGRGPRTGAQVWSSRGERAGPRTARQPPGGGALQRWRRGPDGMTAEPGRPPRGRGQGRAPAIGWGWRTPAPYTSSEETKGSPCGSMGLPIPPNAPERRVPVPTTLPPRLPAPCARF
jgi:hypothetical protein